jgi:CHAT domain-containing protein
MLEGYKPDPAKVEALRATVKKEPPPGASGNTLGEFYLERGRAALDLGMTAEALADLEKAADQFAPMHALRYRTLADLAHFQTDAGRASQALASAERLSRETGGMAGYGLLADTISAHVYTHVGEFDNAKRKLAAAESNYMTVLMVARNAPETMRHAHDLNIERARSFVFQNDGKWAEAEAAERRSLRARQRALDAYPRFAAADFPRRDTFQTLLERGHSSVAGILVMRGRLAEAELFSRESVRLTLERVGRSHPFTAQRLQQLAQILVEQGRTSEGVLVAQEALRSAEESGAIEESLVLAAARRTLLGAYVAAGRHADAIRVFERYRDGARKDPSLARSLSAGDIDWVIAYLKSGEVAEASATLQPMLDWSAQALRPEDDRAAWIRAYHGVVLAARGSREQGLVELRAAVPILIQSLRAQIAADGGSVRQLQRLAIVLETYIGLLAERAASGTTEPGFDPVGEAFRVADVARGSGVQRALSASTVRASARDPALADLARKEQDTRWRIQSLNEVLLRIVALPPEQQLPKITAEIRRDIESLTKTSAGLREELRRKFPDYADLMDPRPTTLADAQKGLRPGEALVSFYVGEEASYVWAVPAQGQAKLARVPLKAGELAQQVAKLRRALEPAATRIEDVPEFDVVTAGTLYDALLRPVEEVFKGSTTLFVVPHGPLGQLPLAVLPTGPAPAGTESVPFERYRGVPWLAKQVTIAQLPSAGTLASLRRAPPVAAAKRTFVGFGDPVFGKAQAGEGALASRGALALRSVPKLDKVDSADLAQLPRLPDTAEEVREVAKALGADPSRDVYLREAASEKTLLAMNLAEPRIIAFATHGLVPGDLNGLTQPALALSAPEVVKGDDDGLLTMEEILGLKLNAEWVVLSACNTAAGSGAGAEAVSGLGRAFFYAGARALLVSNWPVETRSARELMVGVFERYAKDPSQRKSAALREAMLAMIDGEGYRDPASGKSLYRYAHPLFWAPFVVVGD